MSNVESVKQALSDGAETIEEVEQATDLNWIEAREVLNWLKNEGDLEQKRNKFYVND